MATTVLAALATTLSASDSSLVELFIDRTAPQPKPSTTCILGKCGTRIASCLADHDCRSGLVCTARCVPNDQACIFQCTSDFEDATYDNMIRCFFTEHDCERHHAFCASHQTILNTRKN